MWQIVQSGLERVDLASWWVTRWARMIDSGETRLVAKGFDDPVLLALPCGS